MKRPHLGSAGTSIAIGLLAAAVGFSYALATGNSTDGAANRAASLRPPLVFTNPFVVGTAVRDLGDAALGSTITRNIRARGGYPPHRFTSDRTTLGNDGTPLFIGTTTLGEAEVALPASANGNQSTAAVFLNGLLKGKVGTQNGTIADGTPLDFDVTVGDQRAVTQDKVNDTFRLTLVDPNLFKFAQSSLTGGIQFRRYSEDIDVIAGHAPYTFSASNITITNGGTITPVVQFEDVGLFLNPKSGLLDGRPVLAGTYSFTVDAVDKSGSHALSRDKNSVGQVFSFTVDANNRVTSELFSTKMSIKGDTLNVGADTIQYSGLLNLEDMQVSDLDGLSVVLSIGSYTSPAVVLSGGKGTSSGSPSMSVSIDPSGILKISIKDDSFGAAQSIIKNSELANRLKILAVNVTIDNPNDANKPTFASSELLKFHIKAKSSKFDLEYKFGPDNLGGGFIITSVTGKDDSAETGDAWFVKFISLPPDDKKLASFGTIASAKIGIGTDFTGTIPATLKGDKVTSDKPATKPDPSSPVVLSVSYDSKSGKGDTVTGVLPFMSNLPNLATNIKPALTANGKSSPFPFIITFNDASGKELFGAEGSRRINPKGNQWVNKNLNK